ncbi:hypothetical protein DCS_07697 [Drechmeria coniospora]|uniref:Pre-rRNA processing protein n=1 Tax=Drechmeria coniospora TaxID=98403 RepID=A0A151GF61_DRECN|nr:hypothetical protein DCS_07697 [Drechmeria coniospora]KYK55733.1 hypothetical protein DCS_07697 [Drechmeria coniospora]
MPSKRKPAVSRAAETDEDEYLPDETSPLLSDQQEDDGDVDQPAVSTTTRAKKSKGERRKSRWPSFIAIIVLAALVISIIVLGFIVPPAVQEYVEKSVIIEPTSLSLESLTADGVRIRVQAHFRLDGSRVADENAQRIGRIATSIIRRFGAGETKLDVRLPQYGNNLLGTAVVPPLSVDLVDGHNNELDFVTDVVPGNPDTVRNVVNDWLKGNLNQLKVSGRATLSLSAGFIPLGTHDVLESMVFEAHEIPSLPEYKIEQLVFHDVPVGDDGQMGVGANVTVTLRNDYPVALTVPSLGFEVLVPNCDPSEPNIKVASAVTTVIDIRSKSKVTAEAKGVMRELPESLTKACPNTKLSPLDSFMERYLHDETAQVFVRGDPSGLADVPDWAGELLTSITVPIGFPGRSLDNFIRNFSLTDVDFKLPSPIADPNGPDSNPRVSGTVQVLAALPPGLNIDLTVDRLRANGTLYYKSRKFGELHLDKWQKAHSTITPGREDEEDIIAIISRIVDAPVKITNGEIFRDIVQKLLFGDKDILLDVEASVDVEITTVLGKLIVKDVPAEGKVPVKHIPGRTIGALQPQIRDVRIVNTSHTGVLLQAAVRVTNPTPYSATVPYVSLHIMKDGLLIGEAIAKDIHLRLGDSSDIKISLTWDPLTFGGETARRVSRRLLSEYLSGKNTTIEVRSHRGTIPAIPILGEALSKINITLDTPRIKLPEGDDDSEGQGFVRHATFHLLSSTATFMLASPLRRDTAHIEHINATAFYNHTEPVGEILHEEPFDAPPGISQTPRLSVEWSTSHVGFDKLKEALGGTLELDAVADVTVRLGNWVEKVKYEGKGIGAKISL